MINIQSVVQNCKLCEAESYCWKIPLLKCAQYTLVNSYDIIILLARYKKSKNEWDKILFSRILATYLYDLFQNIFVVFRIDRISEIDLSENQALSKKIKGVLKLFSKKRNESEHMLQKVRNLTLAHKDIDAFNLFKEIDQIDHDKIYNISVDLLPYTNDLILSIMGLLTAENKKHKHDPTKSIK